MKVFYIGKLEVDLYFEKLTQKTDFGTIWELNIIESRIFRALDKNCFEITLFNFSICLSL